MFNKKFIVNIALNLFSISLPILVIQFLINPMIAKTLSDAEFGLMITLVGIVGITRGTFGNSLNNSRLLNDSKYKIKGESGDFNILLLSSVFLNIIFILIITYIYTGSFNIFASTFIVLFSVALLVIDYLTVQFRLKLDYSKTLICNFILVLGYGVGYVIYNYTGYWQLIYVTGSGLSFLYLLFNTNLLKEPLKKTALFKSTLKGFIILAITAFIGQSITYIDRILIAPILGKEQVAVFYISMLMGKSIALLLGPISGVVLSYLVKIQNLSPARYLKFLLVIIVMCVPAFLIMYFGSLIVIPILYPDFFGRVVQLLIITSLISVFDIIRTFNSPILLRFCKIKLQLIIKLISISIYAGLGVLLTLKFGIMGFAFALLLSNLVIETMTSIIIMVNLKTSIDIEG